MGQMTTGVILASRVGEPPKKFTEDDGEGWYELVMTYPATKKGLELSFESLDGHGMKDTDLLGFWVALGSYGEKGAPAFVHSFSLDACGPGLLDVPVYKKAHKKAAQAWTKFDAWAEKKHGILFSPPGLWVVRTEVA